jgi:hypothetical protein
MLSRRFRPFALAVLALFALAGSTAQLEHHDIACHLKTPQHCTACAANPPGADSHAPSLLDRIVLADAGGTLVEPSLLVGIQLPVRCSGRAPPQSA